MRGSRTMDSLSFASAPAGSLAFIRMMASASNLEAGSTVGLAGRSGALEALDMLGALEALGVFVAGGRAWPADESRKPKAQIVRNK